MSALFPGRDPAAGTDERFDSMLKQAFEPSLYHEPALSPARLLEGRTIQPPAEAEHQERTPIPPLIKAYWLVGGLLLLLLISRSSSSSVRPKSRSRRTGFATHSSTYANSSSNSQRTSYSGSSTYAGQHAFEP
jgi:hypothetical protein